VGKIQRHSSFRLVDGTPRDTTEALVELYYQAKGYITSSNKWFKGGERGGYKDIDILAVNGEETIIVNVSTNLDDKNLEDLDKYYKAVISYFDSSNEYRWLLKNKICRILAVFTYSAKRQEKITEHYRSHNIELLYASQIFDYFRQNLISWRELGLKTENPLVKTMQLTDYFIFNKKD
jgi:hypothetical protein